MQSVTSLTIRRNVLYPSSGSKCKWSKRPKICKTYCLLHASCLLGLIQPWIYKQYFPERPVNYQITWIHMQGIVYYISKCSDWLRAGRPRGRSSSPSRGKNFLFSMSFRQVLDPTQPPIQWVPGVITSVAKQSGRVASHLPLTRAHVKKTWNYTSTPPYAFMAWCLLS
jgi:hypothetical protein